MILLLIQTKNNLLSANSGYSTKPNEGFKIAKDENDAIRQKLHKEARERHRNKTKDISPLKEALGRLQVISEPQELDQSPELLFAKYLNEYLSKTHPLQILGFFLDITKDFDAELIDKGIINNEAVEPEHRLLAFATKIYNLKQNNQDLNDTDKEKIRLLIKNLVPASRTYINQQGNIVQHLIENIGTRVTEIKAACLSSAGIISIVSKKNPEIDDKALESIFDVANASIQVSPIYIGTEFPNNAISELRYLIDINDPPTTQSFLGTVFHEITHRRLMSQYGFDVNDIHGASIHEVICDLANAVNVHDLINPSKQILFEMADRLGYERDSKLVHEQSKGICPEEHAIARTVLHDIFEESKKHEDRLYLPDLLRELYANSFKVIAECPEEGREDNLKFPNFVQKIVAGVEDFLNSKGLTMEVDYPGPATKDELISLFNNNGVKIESKEDEEGVERKLNAVVRVPRIRIVQKND